ncbi:MAG: DUF4920 domain-containing protein [Sphingobacteriaceae bacterium]|nr:MAG: DUF4920 domain-containing protein [Sphingobacteriaceae bacterium]
MRWLFLMSLLLFIYTAQAQQPVPLPHGMVFGDKPDTSNSMAASKLRDFIGVKKRISTVLKGTIVKVTKEKGGWFELDAGDNNTISAHFKNYNVTLPAAIKGRVVIIDGVAKRQFSAAKDQHFAGDTITYKTGGQLHRKIDFEVKGLMVYQ